MELLNNSNKKNIQSEHVCDNFRVEHKHLKKSTISQNYRLPVSASIVVTTNSFLPSLYFLSINNRGNAICPSSMGKISAKLNPPSLRHLVGKWEASALDYRWKQQTLYGFLNLRGITYMEQMIKSLHGKEAHQITRSAVSISCIFCSADLALENFLSLHFIFFRKESHSSDI